VIVAIELGPQRGHGSRDDVQNAVIGSPALHIGQSATGKFSEAR
jgi:hypothetical protein